MDGYDTDNDYNPLGVVEERDKDPMFTILVTSFNNHTTFSLTPKRVTSITVLGVSESVVGYVLTYLRYLPRTVGSNRLRRSDEGVSK